MTFSMRNVLIRMCVLLSFFSGQRADASLEATTLNPKQGQTIEVTAIVEDAAEEPSLSFNDRKFKMFAYPNAEGQASNVYKTLLTIPADLAPGKYPLSMGGDKLKLTVVDARFPVQHLRLPRGKDNFKTSPGEEETVDKAKAFISEERRWKGAFLKPSKARVSSGFGIKRVVNGKALKGYFHSGLDFAGAQGSPVTACAPGTVLIAHNGWRLHGNTVAIDHGQGVVSFYIHLQKILVKEGDSVSAGQTIGRIGQTGRASGPHLHFSIYVNQTAANPWQWFKGIM